MVSPERSFVIPNISWDRIIRTSVGLRPYRPSGWRVEAERYGDKIVIHNYGHGSEGGGMSWGTAHLDMEGAHKTGHKRCAVAGGGWGGPEALIAIRKAPSPGTAPGPRRPDHARGEIFMGRRYDNVLETIGNTPVVKIGKPVPAA